ncbi:hypothetical protein SDC9_49492 [bioreactor metagenome]|uniref:Uncharacterized protein n=1 Tax=bioreactor metagenome TaxID=1076179 RepID=A0A644WI32_9ZZZZ
MFLGLVDGLVEACGVEGQVTQDFSGGGVDDGDVEVVDEGQDVGSCVGLPDPDAVEGAVVTQGDRACFGDSVVADPVVGVAAAVGAGGGFRSGGVGGHRGRVVRQGPVWAVVVVFLEERIDQGLQRVDGGGLVGLGGQPFLHRLLEAFDLALGGRAGGSPVLLDDAATTQLVLEHGPPTAAGLGREPDGIDQAVVGQRRGGVSVLVTGLTERVTHDPSGDRGMCCGVEGVAGVVVEPGDDLHIASGAPVGAGEAVVGEIGLPTLVRLVGLETDVGTLRTLPRLGGDGPCTGEDPMDRRARQTRVVVMGQVPGDRVRAGVQTRPRQLVTHRDDQLDHRWWSGVR